MDRAEEIRQGDPLRGSQSVDNMVPPKPNPEPEKNFRNSADNLPAHNKSRFHRGNLAGSISRIFGENKKPHNPETKLKMDELDGGGKACFEEIPSPVEAAFGTEKVVTFELEEYDPESQDHCTKWLEKAQKTFRTLWRRNRHRVKYLIVLIMLLLYTIYFGFAIYTSPPGALVLIVLTAIVVFNLLFAQIWRCWGDQIYAATCAPVASIFEKPWWKYCRW